MVSRQAFKFRMLPGPWVSVGRWLKLDTWYVLKTRSQMFGEKENYKYWMKFWKLSDPEPADRDLKGIGAANNSPNGSVVLGCASCRRDFWKYIHHSRTIQRFQKGSGGHPAIISPKDGPALC